MLRKILLPTIFVVLGYGFWVSPDFKEISAGIAIFLFGMISLEEGFKAFTGGALEKILKVSTNKQWKSVGFGVLTTTIMQSSSLVSVITISFLSAGLLNLAAGIGIIFGANIGTTTGAWLVAGLGLKVKISAYAMPMLVFGVILILQKAKKLQGVGYILAGLGFLFLGIHFMKSGFDAFKDTIDLAKFAVDGVLGLFIFSFIGIAATVIMQSSHATLVLIITALSAQQITYDNALALAIGANVGTTVTAVLGAMSANIAGKRLAGAHFVFNVFTGLFAIIFLGQFLVAVDAVSSFVGIAMDDYTLKLAVFHTLFNLAGVILLWPFIQSLVTFLERKLVDKQIVEGALFLDDITVDFPETAVVAIRKETVHVYDISFNVLCDGISLTKDDICGERPLRTVVPEQRLVAELDIDSEYEQKIKGIYSEIIAFISKASFSWEVEQSETIHWLRTANLDIVEAVKHMKHLRKNMSRFMNSSNPDVQKQYDELRIAIAQVMREINIVRQAPDNSYSSETFNRLRNEAETLEKNFSHQTSELLHTGKISPLIATSMINDNNYTIGICKHLISMAETVYTLYSKEDKIIEGESSD